MRRRLYECKNLNDVRAILSRDFCNNLASSGSVSGRTTRAFFRFTCLLGFWTEYKRALNSLLMYAETVGLFHVCSASFFRSSTLETYHFQSAAKINNNTRLNSLQGLLAWACRVFETLYACATKSSMWMSSEGGPKRERSILPRYMIHAIGICSVGDCLELFFLQLKIIWKL